MVLHLLQQPLRLQVGEDFIAGFEALEPLVADAGGAALVIVSNGRRRQIDVGGLVQNREAGERVALPDGKVVGVVRGRDLDGAGAKFRIGPVVGDDR